MASTREIAEEVLTLLQSQGVNVETTPLADSTDNIETVLAIDSGGEMKRIKPKDLNFGESENAAKIEAEVSRAKAAEATLKTEAAETYETIENVAQVQRTFSEELGKKLSKEEAKEIYITYADAEAEHNTRLEAEQELRYAISTNRTERITADEAITAELEKKVEAKDTALEVDSIEETLVTNALRKTAQILTDAEKAQVQKNIGVDAVRQQLQQNISTVQQSQSQSATSLRMAITDEANRATAAEKALGNRIDNIQPVEFTGTVVNAPDEEDITEVDNALKLKDRPWGDGMGYVILRKNKSLQEQIVEENTIYEVRYDFDLNDEEITIPENCILSFNGGSLSNGVINGTESSVVESKNRLIFSNIIINGTWINSKVYSDWFDFSQEVNYDNLQNFRNMMTLADSNVMTDIYIKSGEFYTRTYSVDEDGAYSGWSGIIVPSNVYIHNSATIRAISSSYENTSIFYLGGVENVTIDGGRIIGDVRTHTGDTGEWGYGIYLYGAKNIVIKNIEASECWGDGINIQSFYEDYENQVMLNHCRNILIDNVRCLNNRRQGMSIEAAEDVLVRNSEFSGTGSIKHTAPGCGIDIEPWHDYQIIKNITIQDCKLENNKSHFNVHLRDGNEADNNIIIKNCEIPDGSIFIKNVNTLTVSNCSLVSFATTNSVKNIKLLNSNLLSEIYFDGYAENVIVDKCYMDSVNAPWSGFGVSFCGSKAHKNITVSSSYINTRDRIRVVHVEGTENSVHFINNIIEGEGGQEFPLGYGRFIGNKVLLFSNLFLKLIKTTDGEVLIKHNTFTNNKYSNYIITINDEIPDGDTSNYYNICDNVFISADYWSPFSVKDPKTKVKLLYNTWDKDIKALIPQNWTYAEKWSTSLPAGKMSSMGNNKYVGLMIFDTDINKIVVWNGSKWVDATGAEV